MPHKLDSVLLHRILGGPELSFDSASRVCEALSIEELAGAYDSYWFRDAFNISPEMAERLYHLAILIVYNIKKVEEDRKKQLTALFPKLDQKTIERIAEVEIGKLNTLSVGSLRSYGLTEKEARVLFRWAQFKYTERTYREIFPGRGDKLLRSTEEDDSAEPAGGLTIRH